MLYFPKPYAPIRLYTDASDYGIGAHLYQLVDNVEIPISFISKSLSKEELKWSVPEKEAFAIFYAFRKLEAFLRDTHFTLYTDHKNLTYINDNGSPKVRRWKMEIQEYDFDIYHIEGEKNVVADHFSRLCPNLAKNEGKEFENLYHIIDDDEEENDIEYFYLQTEGEDINNIDSRVDSYQSHYMVMSAVHNSTVGHH